MFQGEEENQERVPNLKHVMNPEGKTPTKQSSRFLKLFAGRMVEWGDLEQSELPNIEMVANHALPNVNTPDPIAKSLEAEAGKGEPSLSRPSTFVSAYRRVFEQNRVVFGAQEAGAAKSPESPQTQDVEAPGAGPTVTGLRRVGSPQIPHKNTQSPATPNLNRMVGQKHVTIVESKVADSKDSIVKDKNSRDIVEMKPVTIRIKEGGDFQPTAPPRKTHFQESPRMAHKPLDNRTAASPLTPTTPHFIGVKKALDNRATAPLIPTIPHLAENQKELDNQATSKALPLENRTQSSEINLDNRRPLRRHASFNDKSNLDNRKTRASVWESDNLNVTSRPTDVLKTPYLLSSSTRALHHPGTQNFPPIPGTSMVAKYKELFEGPTVGHFNLVPLTKSRTFSSFPTSSVQETSTGPLTPSVPQRNSSRKVFNTFKSMNGNINDCGTDSSSSPATQRRIPMANFF